MDALARTRFWRSAVTRVTVSWSGILLLCLCSSGCAGGPILTALPQPTLTAVTPEPTPPLTRFAQELVRSSWQLDGVVVEGQMRPPWNPEQCMAVGYRPEAYFFYTGCNYGHCDPRQPASVPPGEPYVICALTVQGCVTTPDASGASRPVDWERPFADAMMERRTAEVRDAKLWLTSQDKSKPVLVFRRVNQCQGEDNYLRP